MLYVKQRAVCKYYTYELGAPWGKEVSFIERDVLY